MVGTVGIGLVVNSKVKELDREAEDGVGGSDEAAVNRCFAWRVGLSASDCGDGGPDFVDHGGGPQRKAAEDPEPPHPKHGERHDDARGEEEDEPRFAHLTFDEEEVPPTDFCKLVEVVFVKTFLANLKF